MDNSDKVLVIGAGGFLGAHFYRAYREHGRTVIGTSHNSTRDRLMKLDLSSIRNIQVHLHSISVAVIAGGISGIKACERDPDGTRKINVLGVLKLAELLVDHGISLTWFSSDAVFDGKKGAYSETDPVNPLNEYGRQKVEVEEKLLDRYKGNALVLRLSKVYGIREQTHTLLEEIANGLSKNKTVYAAWDNLFCPTCVDDVVNVALLLQKQKQTGLFHVAAPEFFSRYDVALLVAKALGLNPALVKKIRLNDFHGGNFFPLKTDMVCRRLIDTLKDYRFMPLQTAIHALRDYLQNQA